MSAPYPGPKPVGPPPPPGKQGPPPGPPQYGRPGSGPWPGQEDPYASAAPPRMRVYSWSSGWSPTGRRFPWFAILLLVLGIGLLIELLIPDLSVGSLIILAAGLAFATAWLFGHVAAATMPALVLTAWGLAGIGTDLGILTGDGWTALLVGLAFLAGWGLGRFGRVRRDWALVLGAILGIIGLADVSDALNLDLDITVLIPLAMIVVGVYFILRGRRLGRT
jgi:hypothetical protein